MNISKKGIDLIKHFEGCYKKAYLCPANVWTIGIGTTGFVDGKPIGAGMEITEEKAEQLLAADLIKFEKVVSTLITVPLNQNQFDALVSFAYNCGEGALKNSTLRKLLNKNQYGEVPAQLNRWNKAGGKVLEGLSRRRRAEGKLFSKGILDFS